VDPARSGGIFGCGNEGGFRTSVLDLEFLHDYAGTEYFLCDENIVFRCV